MNKKAFSLIELIVGITISMILMVSVGVFINNGMQNIFSQQKVLENTDNFTYFADNLNTSFNLIQSGSFIPQSTSSGIIFKRSSNFGEGGFTYIGTEVLDGIYCEPDSEDTETNSIYIKKFIPFEEDNTENIFNNYNDILTATSGIYTSYQKEHVIKDGSTVIIGKGIFGDKFTEGALGTEIYLNSPTGLAQDGNILYVSDTLNNRVLYYDTNDSSIHKLLDESDGLNEPTGLYYEDNSLYIANSGNGEILKYSSKSTATNPTLTMSGFTENVNEISVSFLGISPTNLTNEGTFNITGNSTLPNYSTRVNDELKYYFITKNPESIQPTCLGTETKFVDDKPSIYCTKSGSGQTTNYPTDTISQIEISNLVGFTNTGSYYINLKLFNGTTEIFSDYFPYFTQGDDDLTTKEDNILTVHKSGLNYPTGIWGTGNSGYNEFGNRTFNNKKLDYHETDILLGTPIKSLNITNTPNDLISLFLKYYNRYNCYNLDDNAERSFLLKKNLK